MGVVRRQCLRSSALRLASQLRPTPDSQTPRRSNRRHHCRTQPASENIPPLSSQRLMAAWEMSTKTGREICQRLLRVPIGWATGGAASAEREKRPTEWRATGPPDRRISVILPVVALPQDVLGNVISCKERSKRQRRGEFEKFLNAARCKSLTAGLACICEQPCARYVVSTRTVTCEGPVPSGVPIRLQTKPCKAN